LAVCFEITINNGVPVLAGLDDISVLSTTVTCVPSRNELELHVGGLVSLGPHDNEHLERLQQERAYSEQLRKRFEPR
jgi:hypothetical protein